MKINEQNSLRVLLLAIALTILGGATGIMFYATQQNESVMASESELLALRVTCGEGWHKENGTCVPNVIEPTEEEKCLAEGKTWDASTNLCISIESVEVKKGNKSLTPSTSPITCPEGETYTDGSCKRNSLICEEDGGYWNQEAQKCIKCTDGETIIDGVCVKKEEIECKQTGGIWTDGGCEHKCDGDMIYKDGACVPDCKDNEQFINGRCLVVEEDNNVDKEKEECETSGGKWDDHAGCIYEEETADENDLDGDGKPDGEDDDIDGDGYLNEDDLNPKHYDVGDRDILMFATLAYEPVSASMDMIAGDTMTGNGNTVAANYYADEQKTTAPEDTAKTGYPDYFNYICSDRVSWNAARDGGRNKCMIDEDRMVGMQAQDYNTELGGILGAWETSNKDFYFGDDQNATDEYGASFYKDRYESRGLGEDAYKGYASIEEVDQWVIVNHVAQRIKFPDSYMPNLLANEGIMQATVFRMNNNFVIAFRGTDFPDLMDWLSDATYATNSIKGYEDAAQEYAKYIVETYSEEYFSNPDQYIEDYGGEPNFYITGHSLAGYLAPIGAIGVINSNVQGKEFLREVVYFNGMGVGLFGSGSGLAVLNGQRDTEFNKLFAWAQETDENGVLLHKVMCYNIYGDPVSALGRHVNQTGYYSAEGAIIYHSTQHVAALQKATRLKLTEALLNAGLWGNPLAKALGEHGEMYNRLDSAKDYMEYYSEVYGHMFKSTFGTTGALSAFDIFFFCHEPSASLFYNIRQGVRGYSEEAKIQSTHSKKTTTLTAEVNGDVESYSWYKNGELVGTGNSYTFSTNELANGTYSVSAVVKTRQSNKEVVKNTVSTEIKIDEAAPNITIDTEGSVKNPKAGEAVNFIVRASDASGFTDGSLSLDDIEISGSMLKKYLTIEEPVLILNDSTETTSVWKVSVKSSVAGALRLIVKEGAFSDASELKSKKASSSIINFTIFEHKQEDKTKPTVKIIPENGYAAEKGGSLRFRIEGFDEQGIDKADIKDKTTFVCTLGSAKIDWSGDVVFSDDGKTAYATAIVSCNDSSKVISIGTLSVGAGTFVDKNGNKSSLKTSASLTDSIRFTAPADKTAPFVKITSDNGWTGEYGDSLSYTITVNDDSGLVIEAPLENNIDIADGIRNGISILSIDGPKYNNDKTIASYNVVVSSNENCSTRFGCGGTFTINAGAFKDTVGNSSLPRISGNIAFAPERDFTPPTVQIQPINGRSAYEGESLSFKVIVKDLGGLNTNKVLTKDDFTITGNGNANIYIDNIEGPTYNLLHTQAEYIVTVKGEGVSPNVQLSVKNGVVKDISGNINSSVLSDIFSFIKLPDLLSPIVTIKPVTSWNAVVGDEINIVVTATDNEKLSKNKSVDASSFSMKKILGNSDAAVKKVSTPTYSNNDKQVSYTVTISASKAGTSHLVVNTGAFKDNSNNGNIQTVSLTPVMFMAKDTTRPTVSFSYYPSSLTVLYNKTVKVVVTVSDDRQLIVPNLKPEHISIVGLNHKVQISDVKLNYSTATEAQWEITVKNSGELLEPTTGWNGNLVRRPLHVSETVTLDLPIFKDGAGNSVNLFDRSTRPITFTRY